MTNEEIEKEAIDEWEKNRDALELVPLNAKVQLFISGYLAGRRKEQEEIERFKIENRRLRSRENPNFNDIEPFDERFD